MILIFALLPLDIIAINSDSSPANSSSISSSVLISNPSTPSNLILFFIPFSSLSITRLTSTSFPSASMVFLFILIFIFPFSISTFLSIFTLIPSAVRNSLLVSSLTLIFLSDPLPDLSSPLLKLPEFPGPELSPYAKMLIGLSAIPKIMNDRNINKDALFMNKLIENMFLKLIVLNS